MSKYFFNISKQSKRKIVSILLSIVTIGSSSVYASDDIPTVRIKVEQDVKFVKTKSKNIEQFLKEQDIVLNKYDEVNHNLSTTIKDGLSIEVNRANEIKFIVDGYEVVVFEAPDCILGKAILLAKSDLGRTFKLDAGQSSALDVFDGMEVRVTEQFEKIYSEIEEIPFETVTVENNQLKKGLQNIKVQGVNGKEEITYKSISGKGQETVTYSIGTEVLQKPISKVIEIGTKVVVEPKTPDNVISTPHGNFEFTNVITAKSTAYTSSTAGKKPGSPGYGVTASGMKAQVGVVAVDTQVIPLGTKLYIEGYGKAIAGDTGGAIKGNKVDVYFNTVTEALNYGVKTVKVYILK